MNILITGDSHLAALDRALNADAKLAKQHNVTVLPLGNSEVSHSPYFLESDSCVEITAPRYQNHLTQLPPAGMDVDIIALSLPFHTLGMIRNARLWKNYAPYTLDIADRHILSHATIKRMVLAQQQYNLQLLQCLQSIVPAVIVLEGPRLFSHHKSFKETASDIILEIDRLYRDIIQIELCAVDIPMVRCPQQTYNTETGLMNPDFKTDRADDQHHANTEFGKLVLKALFKSLTSEIEAKTA